jgi:hypothetical protein
MGRADRVTCRTCYSASVTGPAWYSASDRSRQRFTVNEIKTTLSVWSSILGHNFSCNVGPKVTASAAMFRAPKITYEP